MPSDKDGFVSYKSHFKALEHLSDELLGKLSRAVYHYQISGIEPEKDSPIYFPFAFMKLSFDSDDLKYQAVIERNKANGLKGGRPATNPEEPNKPSGLSGNPKNPGEPKEPDKDKDKDKDKERSVGAADQPINPLPAKEEKEVAPVSAPPAAHRSVWNEDEQAVSESPLAKPQAFEAILRELHPAIYFEYYRNKIAAKSEGKSMPVHKWRNWIIEFMEREQDAVEKRGGQLRIPNQPPPPNEVSTNAPPAAPMAQVRIQEPELNAAFVGQQQANRQAESVARLQNFATSTANKYDHGTRVWSPFLA